MRHSPPARKAKTGRNRLVKAEKLLARILDEASCLTAEDLLLLVVPDRTASASPSTLQEVQEHVTTCADCRNLLQLLQSTERTLTTAIERAVREDGDNSVCQRANSD